jgi:hypothetical protein
MHHPKPAAAYEPPKLIVLGTVHALTQKHDYKQHGPSDGFMFLAPPLTNSS